MHFVNETFYVVSVLKDKFLKEPSDTTAAVGQSVTLHCDPPRGKPDPKVRGELLFLSDMSWLNVTIKLCSWCKTTWPFGVGVGVLGLVFVYECGLSLLLCLSKIKSL